MGPSNVQRDPLDAFKRASNERNALDKNHSSQQHCSKILIGNQIVGEVKNSVFSKRVHSSRHFLKKPASIAFSIETIEQAKSKGATKVEITDLDTGKIYTVSMELLLEKGFEIDRGFGLQIALPLSYWQINEAPEKKQPGFWG